MTRFFPCNHRRQHWLSAVVSSIHAVRSPITNLFENNLFQWDCCTREQHMSIIQISHLLLHDFISATPGEPRKQHPIHRCCKPLGTPRATAFRGLPTTPTTHSCTLCVLFHRQQMALIRGKVAHMACFAKAETSLLICSNVVVTVMLPDGDFKRSQGLCFKNGLIPQSCYKVVYLARWCPLPGDITARCSLHVALWLWTS